LTKRTDWLKKSGECSTLQPASFNHDLNLSTGVMTNCTAVCKPIHLQFTHATSLSSQTAATVNH